MRTPFTVSAVERAEVVIRLPLSGQGRVRVGAVLARGAGRPVRVRWEDDGEEEDVKLDNHNRLAVRDSLRHEWLVDPASVTARIAADPVGMIVRLIQENPPMTAREHKNQLVTLGLDQDSANKAWTEASKAFKKRDDVSLDTKKRYVWYPPPAPAEGAAADGSIAESNPAAEPEQPAQAVPGEEPAQAPPEALVEPEHGAEAAAPEQPRSSTPVEQPVTLADLLAAALGDDTPKPVHQHAQTPLRTGIRLGRLDDSALDNLLSSVQDEDRSAVAALLMAVPRQVSSLDRADHAVPLASMAPETVLRSAVAEIRDQPEPSRAQRAAAAWLVRRLAAADVLDPVAIPPLAEVTGYIAASDDAAIAGVADIGAQALSRLLPQVPPDRRSAVDLEALAGAVVHLPLRPHSGRAALVAAVGRVRPDSLVADRWWHGASLKDLADCANGLLGSVTSMSAVAERVVRPMVLSEITAATSRRRLSFLLGLPAEFAAQIPAEAVAAAFQRIGREDSVVGVWVEALTDTERMDGLKRELEKARGTAAAAIERAEASAKEFAVLTERCDRLEQILRHEHSQAVRLRSSQERQIRIDVVRALADLAAEVEELAADNTSPDVLIERVRALVASNALEPIGTAGADAPFDPALHKPIVGRPQPGTSVSVIRPGYRWRSTDEVVLISKALVSAI